jgi:translation initiation factor 2 gamma subunit (eIF-2gamma)
MSKMQSKTSPNCEGTSELTPRVSLVHKNGHKHLASTHIIARSHSTPLSP